MPKYLIENYVIDHPENIFLQKCVEYIPNALPEISRTLYPVEVLEMTEVIDYIISASNHISVDDKHIMYQAIVYEKYDIISKLIDKGYDIMCEIVYTWNDVRMYPLCVALKYENIEVCDFLISMGADVSVNSGVLFEYFFENNKSFNYLVQHCDNLEFILSGIDTFCRRNRFRKDRDEDVLFTNIQSLVKNGLDINKIVSDFYYYLYDNIFSLGSDHFQFLINNGLNPNNNMLYYALLNNNSNLVDILLDNGLFFDAECTLKIFSSCNINNIHIALKYNCDFSLVQHEDPLSQTVFDQIMDTGCINLVYFLLERN